MRQVNVRVMNPSTRFEPNVRPLTVSWDTAENAFAFVLICAFWGVILFLGLTTLQ